MRRAWQRISRGWMAFAHLLGRIQTWIILTVIYVLGIGVVGPIYRLVAGDPLDRSFRRTGSAWVPRERSNATLDDARHLF